MNDYLLERYNCYELEMMEEMVPYELIHQLLDDILRLEYMVMDTRDEVNRLIPVSKPRPYPTISQDVCCGVYYDHPAMVRYLDLYGDHAIVLWEN